LKLDAPNLTNVNVAALDAASPAAVASCYLTPTSENLYPCCSLRHLKVPARPAKHTRQTYIHEAFRILLYQTRYGVICFVPFPQPTNSPADRPVLLSASAKTSRCLTRSESARTQQRALNTLTPDLTGRRWEPGGRSLRRADEYSASRCADIVRPVCSREIVTRRLYTTRNNQNFTSEKFAKTVSVEFGRRDAAFYFWEGTSATRWE
jgi:hypothetical protein